MSRGATKERVLMADGEEPQGPCATVEDTNILK